MADLVLQAGLTTFKVGETDIGDNFEGATRGTPHKLGTKQTPPSAETYDVFSYLLDNSTTASDLQTGDRSDIGSLEASQVKPPNRSASSQSRLESARATLPGFSRMNYSFTVGNSSSSGGSLVTSDPARTQDFAGDQLAQAAGMQEMNPDQLASVISPGPFVAHSQQLPAHLQVSSKAEENSMMATAVLSQTLPKGSSPPMQGKGATITNPESDVSQLVLRKFSSLNRRVLFHLQEEITCLETELRELDQLQSQAEADENRMKINKQNTSHSASNAYMGQLRWRYNELLTKANRKLCEYRQCSYTKKIFALLRG